MFVLHIDLQLKAGSAEDLQKTYHESFRPAISAQEGFVGVHLLRPQPGGDGYRLVIAFAQQSFQQKWVATDVHQRVWPMMEAYCVHYAVTAYEAV